MKSTKVLPDIFMLNHTLNSIALKSKLKDPSSRLTEHNRPQNNSGWRSFFPQFLTSLLYIEWMVKRGFSQQLSGIVLSVGSHPQDQKGLGTPGRVPAREMGRRGRRRRRGGGVLLLLLFKFDHPILRHRAARSGRARAVPHHGIVRYHINLLGKRERRKDRSG